MTRTKTVDKRSFDDCRPTVKCLAAPPLSEGRVKGNPLVVSLETADWLKTEFGWAIVGPDPTDMCELEPWEKAQRATSWPRWS